MADIFSDKKDESSASLPITDLDTEFVERRTVMREDIKMPFLTDDYEPYEYNVGHMG